MTFNKDKTVTLLIVSLCLSFLLSSCKDEIENNQTRSFRNIEECISVLNEFECKKLIEEINNLSIKLYDTLIGCEVNSYDSCEIIDDKFREKITGFNVSRNNNSSYSAVPINRATECISGDNTACIYNSDIKKSSIGINPIVLNWNNKLSTYSTSKSSLSRGGFGSSAKSIGAYSGS